MLNRFSLRPATTTSVCRRMATPRVSMVSRHLSSSSSRSTSSSAGPVVSNSNSDNNKDAPVLFEAEHSLRKIILNRPKALNSLNDEMVSLILPQLEKFEQSDLANVVLIKSNSKHFCAGGDVVSLAKSLDQESEWKKASGFFKKEYIMNHFLATMSKPVISLMNGVAFGGGLGLSMHGAFRVATETTQVAMPETKIGLFPDVGANFFLPRLDGQLGIYLALTSIPLKGAGAYLAGFTSHYVPSERLAALETRLGELDSTATVSDVNDAINEYSADRDELGRALQGYKLVGPVRRALDHVFSLQTAEEMLSTLEAIENGSDSELLTNLVRDADADKVQEVQQWAKETREAIELRSPTSVKLSIKAIREGAKLNIEEVLAMDNRIAAACCSPSVHTDFRTGVTEFLINKVKPEDQRPAWTPSTLAEVSPSSLQSIFFSSPPPFKNPPVPSFKPRQSRTPQRLNPLSAYKTHPYSIYGLPTEARIESVVKGSDKDSPDYARTRGEVVAKFEAEYSGKVGVREKVEEVLDRRTVLAQENTLRWV